MPKHLIVEEEKSSLSPILIIDTNSGIQNKLLDLLADSLEGKLKVYALTKKNVGKNVNIISPLSIHLLERISDELKYSVIFLDEESQMKKVIEMVDMLEVHNPRILILIPYRITERFIDAITSLKDRRNISIGLVGDLFGESLFNSSVSKIIKNALDNKEVVISGNELFPIFPISETDLVNSIEFILFSKKRDFLYPLFYEHPQTLLSLTHLLKRTEPELSVSFKVEKINSLGEKTQEQKDKDIHERTGLSPKKLDDYIGFEKSVSLMQHKTPQNSRRSALRKKRLNESDKLFVFGKMLRFLIYGFAVYILISLTLFFASLIFFRMGVLRVLDGDLDLASINFETAKNLYGQSKVATQAIASAPFLFSNTYLYDYINIYENVLMDSPILVDTLKKVDSSTLDKTQLEKSFASLFELYFIAQRYNLKEVYETLKIEDPHSVSKFASVIGVLPQALGFDSPKNYLLLFQNNNELRPTGGFIGSASYVTLKNGEMDSIGINDVYDLDGQLKEHVEPHFIIRRYLQPHLYLRDSNFSPNFEESASQSAFLYNQVTGKRVDGIIAIDTLVLKEMIKITGPFDIAGVGQVSSSNVIDLVQRSIENNFFPGSTNKKDILNSILNKVVVMIENPKKKMELLKILPKLVYEKHILFAFSNNSVNKAFSAAGFTSNLQDLRIEKNVLKDLFSINEANIGANKVNALVTRKVNYSAYLNRDKLDSEISLDYTNKAKEPYTAYLRIIVPATSDLSSVSINSENQEIVPAVTDFKFYEKTNFEPPAGLEVDQDIKDEKKNIGFIIKVPSFEKTRIKINLNNSNIIPDEGSFNYSLLYLKQPGTLAYPLTVALLTDENFEAQGNLVIFDGEIGSDQIFTQKVTRKR